MAFIKNFDFKSHLEAIGFALIVSGMATLFGYNPPHVAHAQCIGSSCVPTSSTSSSSSGGPSFTPPSLTSSAIGSSTSLGSASFVPTSSSSLSSVSASALAGGSAAASVSAGGIINGIRNIANAIFGSVTQYLSRGSLHVWGINVTNGTNAAVQGQACKLLGFTATTERDPNGGRFAAMLMVVSGIIAIVAGAAGSYKTALATLTVGVGSSILEEVIQLFFGDICDPTIGINFGGILG